MDITTMHRINERGLAELRAALRDVSTLSSAVIDDYACLEPWAESAEAALDEGFAASVEIPARLSRSGAACVVYLDSDGFDAVEVDLGGGE